MTTLRTQDLIGPALRYAVAIACGHAIEQANHLGRYRVIDLSGNCLGSFMADGSPVPSYLTEWAPDKDWAQGGPLLQMAGLSLVETNNDGSLWTSRQKYEQYYHSGIDGETPLIAAMRAFVYAHFFDEVAIWPDFATGGIAFTCPNCGCALPKGCEGEFSGEQACRRSS